MKRAYPAIVVLTLFPLTATCVSCGQARGTAAAPTTAATQPNDEINRLRATGKGAIPELISHLAEASDNSARPFMNLLADQGVDAAPALAAALKDANEVTRVRAATLLSCAPGCAKAAQPALIDATADSSPRVSAAALRALATIDGDAESLRAAAFTAALDDADAMVSDAAYRGLLTTGSKAKLALPALVNALGVKGRGNGPDHNIYPMADRRRQYNALRAIAMLGPDASEAALGVGKVLRGGGATGDLTAGNPQRIAGLTLAKLGHAAIPELIDALDPQSYYQFIAACAAIEAMGPAAADTADELASGLKQNNQLMVRARLRALCAIGPAAKTALPAIEKTHEPITPIVVERINGIVPTPPTGGYKPIVPAPLGAADDLALVRTILDFASSQGITLGVPLQRYQMRYGLSLRYAKIGDYDRAIGEMGEFSLGNIEFLIAAGLARALAKDDAAAARYFDRARLEILSLYPTQQTGYPFDVDGFARTMLWVGDQRGLEPLMNWPDVANSIIEILIEKGNLDEAQRLLPLWPKKVNGLPSNQTYQMNRIAGAWLAKGETAKAVKAYCDILDNAQAAQLQREGLVEVCGALIGAGQPDIAIGKASSISYVVTRDEVLRDLAADFAVAGDVLRAEKCASLIQRRGAATQPGAEDLRGQAEADVATARAGRDPIRGKTTLAAMIRRGYLKRAVVLARSMPNNESAMTQVASAYADAGDFPSAADILPSASLPADEIYLYTVRKIVKGAATKGQIPIAEEAVLKLSHRIPCGAYRLMAIARANANDRDGALAILEKARTGAETIGGNAGQAEILANLKVRVRIGDRAGALTEVRRLAAEPQSRGNESEIWLRSASLAEVMVQAGAAREAWSRCRLVSDTNEKALIMDRIVQNLLTHACPSPPAPTRYRRVDVGNIWDDE